MTLRLPRLRLPPVAWAGLLALGLVLGLAAGSRVFGPQITIALFALSASGLVALERPGVAVAGLVGVVAMLEASGDWSVMPGAELLYNPLVGPLTPVEALVGLAFAAALLDVLRYGRAVHLRPFTTPLALVVAGLALGAIMGVSADAGFDLFAQARSVAPLVVVAVTVAIVLRDAARVRWAVEFALALACVKGVVGLLGYLAGVSVTNDDGGKLTYYEPLGNFLMLVALLLLLTAALQRASLPGWAIASAPLVLAAFALSLRRSFYLALAAGALIALVAGTGRVGRRLLVPAGVVVAAALYLTLAAGIVSDPERGVTAPVAERVQSLSAKRIAASAQDRYRIRERANVLEELRRQPVTGLGLGVPWAIRSGLSTDSSGQQYAHATVLWWWLKLGVLGPISYLWLMAAGILCGLAVGRRSTDPLVRATGIALAAALVGYGVAETTATFTGADQRMTIWLGAVVGWLAAARAATDADGRLAA